MFRLVEPHLLCTLTREGGQGWECLYPASVVIPFNADGWNSQSSRIRGGRWARLMAVIVTDLGKDRLSGSPLSYIGALITNLLLTSATSNPVTKEIYVQESCSPFPKQMGTILEPEQHQML